MRGKRFYKTISISLLLLTLAGSVFAQDLESTSYKIEGDSLAPASLRGDSTSYGLAGDANPFSVLSNSGNYQAKLGYNPRILAFVPEAPSLTNPSFYYDRLLLEIDPSGNPSDTIFAIAMSTDNWATFKYVQNDYSLGSTLGIEDYQDYTSWGGGSGFLVTGLLPDTTYKARVKALNGDFTETGYGPESAQATTSTPFIRLTVSGDAPFGVLSENAISQTNNVTLTLNTNNQSGYQMAIRGTGDTITPGLYNGLGDLIVSTDATLIIGTEGYGLQASSTTATIDAKYNVVGDTVGALTLSPHDLADNTTTVIDEEIIIRFKAAISSTTVAGEYQDTIYYTVSTNL